MKKIFIQFLLLCCFFIVNAQQPVKLIAALANARTDSTKIRLLNQIGECYLYNDRSKALQLDSAGHYLKKAFALTAKTGDQSLADLISRNLAAYWIRIGDFKKGNELFDRTLNNYRRRNDKAAEAVAWDRLGSCYSNSGKDKSNIGQIKCYHTAAVLYKQIDSVDRFLLSSLDAAYAVMQAGQLKASEDAYREVMKELKVYGPLVKEPRIWYNLSIGLLYFKTDYLDYQADCCWKAYNLFLKTHQTDRALEAVLDAGSYHIDKQRFAKGKKELLIALGIQSENKKRLLYRIYDKLAKVANQENDYKNELSYLVKCVESLPAEEPYKNAYYENLAGFYNYWGMREKAIFWRKKAVDSSPANQRGYLVLYLQSLSREMVADHQEKQALAYIRLKTGKLKNLNNYEKYFIADSYAACYSGLGQFEKARLYIDQMKALYLLPEPGESQGMHYYGLVHAYYIFIGFHIATKEYQQAQSYLHDLDTIPARYTQNYRTEIAFYRFKVDSANKSFAAAVDDYQRYKMLADSENTVTKTRDVNELNIKFEVSEKDRSIVNLRNEKLIQQAKIDRTSLQRNITIAGVIMLLIFAVILYVGFAQKKVSNAQLKKSQEQINTQNAALQHLLDEKEDLLLEKDWLLKEVHHRVKNNLQIIMSLLNSQSAYLENNAAKDAIRESQNRVQAISLIHQKLYSGIDVSTINLRNYVADFVGYLEESFDTKKQNIRFKQLVEPLIIDLAQAVPLGLILNESITNAIKYAFNDQGGFITVEGRSIDTQNFLLTITDDGRGLPGTFKLTNTTSLGMEMMKALTKQLGGAFTISNVGGVQLKVEFPILGTADFHKIKV